MNIILFDAEERGDLLPLTFTRPVSELRMGIFTFSERWNKIFQTEKISFLTQKYLSKKYPVQYKEENIFINPSYFPNQDFILTIKNLKKGEALVFKNKIIAARSSEGEFLAQKFNKKIEYNFNGIHIAYPWNLFTYNKHAINYDFTLVSKQNQSQTLSSTVNVIGDSSKIFIENGVTAEYITLNTQEGVIYLGKNSEIMEGSHIRGSLALCEGSKIHMGAKVYGGTTIGPYSKIGGEVNNSILTAYSNKGHDGFLGNSVLGEWCNLGADTNSSNMKNNYDIIKCWNYPQSTFISTELQFSGLIMGDHSKSAINTQFNTGTVVGVFANIFTSGFPPNIIKSFSWGGKSENLKFNFSKALEVAERMMKRRNKKLSEDEKDILEYLYLLNK